jgi:hypothetical protein
LDEKTKLPGKTVPAGEGAWLALNDPNCQKEPGVAFQATIHQDLPEPVIEVLRKNNLRIKLDKLVAGRLIDQRPGLVASDGCISSPSGPGC